MIRLRASLGKDFPNKVTFTVSRDYRDVHTSFGGPPGGPLEVGNQGQLTCLSLRPGQTGCGALATVGVADLQKEVPEDRPGRDKSHRTKCVRWNHLDGQKENTRVFKNTCACLGHEVLWE